MVGCNVQAVVETEHHLIIAHDVIQSSSDRAFLAPMANKAKEAPSLVPSERSTGDSVRRGSISKSGNIRARRLLVEFAWSYRHPARVGKEKLAKVEAAPKAVREIAWKTQTRLCGRFRKLTRNGKRSTIIATAIARELSAFIWAINREVTSVR